MVLEILDLTFVFLCGFHRIKSAKVPALVGARIFFA